MKNPRTAAIAIALALSSTAAMAATGDAWYGTNRDLVTSSPTGVEVSTREPAQAYYYVARSDRPVIVQREYIVTDPSEVVVSRDDANDFRYSAPEPLFSVEPRAYSRIERGLFNRKGPNDFGA
jgi:hypothetical protein